MTRIASVVTYLAGVAAAIALLNADIRNDTDAVVIWAGASVLLGWGTGQLRFALLAFLAIPFSVPFGHPDQYLGSEPPQIWWLAMFFAFASACLIFATALARQIAETRRHPWAS
jgi:hypothetical protein